MRARIARTIVGVTALVIVVLGVPFAVVLQRFYESSATVELQRSAAEVIAELTVPLRPDEIADAAREPDSPPDFSVYDDTGTRLYGTGPARIDEPDLEQLVVVSPITDRESETVVGSVRVARPEAEVAAQARRAWGLMALAGVAGLALAFFVARREAARLAAPISELASRAARLGSGEFALDMAPTGTPELDTLTDALNISARRLAELLAREREFSANASHQLRTPLTALRVSLERGDVAAASVEVDRLSSTVDHMLALSRDALPELQVVDVGHMVADLAERWTSAYCVADRELVVAVSADRLAARVRPASIEQAIDVLLDNALRHGGGQTRIAARPVKGGVVIQVDDDGPGINTESIDAVFERHTGNGTGIGLDLARTLLEADGARLLLSDPEHAEFRIVLTAAQSSASRPS